MRKVYSKILRNLSIDPLSRCKINPENDLQKLGSEYGSWVIPASRLNHDSTIYCAGCGEDISFDLELIQQFRCIVHGFDPTPRAIDYVQKASANYPQYILHEFGLWDTEEILKFFAPKDASHVSHSLTNLQQTDTFIEVPVRRLSGVMKSLGHTSIDLLKIDIEGAEYRVLESILQDALSISVICVEYDEFHSPLDVDASRRIRESVSSLVKTGYRLVHTQGNGNYTFCR